MKKQDKNFLEKRELIRNVLIMKRLNIKNQTYQKLMGQKVNGIYDRELNDWEVQDIDNSLNEVEQVIKDFRDELHS
jgi:hypothetical protein